MEKWIWTRRTLCALGGVALIAGWSGVASGVTLDFDDLGLGHGAVIGDQYAGVTIIADNENRDFDYAVLFDSSLTHDTRDEDLEAFGRYGEPLPPANELVAWSGGNLQGTELGLMLIIQEIAQGCGTGTCSKPDDEGGRPAGSLSFVFDVPASEVGFDLVDIESHALEEGSVSLLLTDGEGSEHWVEIPFATFLEEDDLGNNTANRVEPFVAAHWAEGQVVDGYGIATLKINLGGSGAIDNVTFEPVPEPGTALLMGLGLAALAARRSR
jgi:hypothetical protein